MPEMPFMIWQGAVSDQRIKRIIEHGENQVQQAATVMGGGVIDHRRSEIAWLNDDIELRNYLFGFAFEANRHWGFHIHNDADIQYTKYKAEDQGHYGLHSDTDWFSPLQVTRKISITVQLSNPDEYAGGDFELEGSSLPPDYKHRGTVLAFPSYLMHMVKPVTSGVRRSLVTWIEGPQWR